MSKLYLRLYLFAVVIMMTSGVISSYVVDLVYRHDRRPGPPPEVMTHVKTQAELLLTLLPKEPKQAEATLKKAVQAENWDVVVMQNQQVVQTWGVAPPPELQQQLTSSGKPDKFWLPVQWGSKTLLIHPNPPMRRPPPIQHLILPYLVTSGVLLLLLIPFVHRIVKPFESLLVSIRRVSIGNYETPLKLKPGSEFESLATEFNNMTAQIKKTLAEKQRLIADVSHELRSPLARLRLSLELMEKKGQVPEKYYLRAIDELEHLDSMIDDLLDASRLELRSRFAPQTTDMQAFIQSLLDKNQLLFQEQGLHVDFEAPNKPLECDIDRELIERTFNNIVANTFKYAQPPAKLAIQLKAAADAVELSFRDNGPGVAAEDCQKIFDPFYRTDDSRTRSTGGVGLGLSIVRKIIQLHRGEVWAEVPADGKGGLLIGMRLPALIVNASTTGPISEL